MGSRKLLAVLLVAFATGGAAGAGLLNAHRLLERPPAAADLSHPVWTEVAWPFPMDEWGKGKAFTCAAANCGTPVNLYIRAKIGFCNCTTGVSDDAELERLSDFRLMGEAVAARGDGRPIAIAWMKGRSRGYGLAGRNAPGRSALSVAFNDRCDAVVATIITGHDDPAMLEPGVLAFLNSRTVLAWTEVTLGL